MYLPKKPKKYSIKVICLADAKTSYLFSAYIYTGKSNDGVRLTVKQKELIIPTHSVGNIRLCKIIKGSNQNVTADILFKSLEDVEELSKKKLTCIGTSKKDKCCIPMEFLHNSDHSVVSTQYCVTSEMM